MFRWLHRGGSTPGWLAISFHETSLELAHARRLRGARVQIPTFASGVPVERAKRDYRLASYQCTTVLNSGDYDLLLVEAPNVPRAEMKSALRWKVKDMVDYPVDEATIDYLEIPPQNGSGRSHHVYAVLARKDVVRERIERFEGAGIPLAVIDIPETAQRNVAALYEEPNRGVALAYFGRNWGLVTISYRGELYFSRRLDIGIDDLAAEEPAEELDGPFERVALEIQRTLDHSERHFGYVAVATLLLAPTERPTGLAEFLRGRLHLPVRQIDLGEALHFRELPDLSIQWRLFHHFGAALRDL